MNIARSENNSHIAVWSEITHGHLQNLQRSLLTGNSIIGVHSLTIEKSLERAERGGQGEKDSAGDGGAIYALRRAIVVRNEW